MDVDVAVDQRIVAGTMCEGMTKRSRIIGFGLAATLIVAGAVGAAVFADTLGQVVALVLIGIGFVLATSLVFLEVGLSEDKERAALQAREARERERQERRERPRERPRRRRLDRMRGRPRRLK